MISIMPVLFSVLYGERQRRYADVGPARIVPKRQGSKLRLPEKGVVCRARFKQFAFIVYRRKIARHGMTRNGAAAEPKEQRTTETRKWRVYGNILDYMRC